MLYSCNSGRAFRSYGFAEGWRRTIRWPSFRSLVGSFESLPGYKRFIRTNPVKEFGGFEGKSYAESTQRVYRSAVKKALKIVGKAPDECESYEELLALFRENLAQKKFPKAPRLAPLLSFLESKLPKKTEEIPGYEPIRYWVLDRIGRKTKATRKPLHFVRRDVAMLACLCVAPEKGSPRS